MPARDAVLGTAKYVSSMMTSALTTTALRAASSGALDA